MDNSDRLFPLVEKLFEKDIRTATSILESLPEENASEIIASLPTMLAVMAVGQLQVGYAADLLERMSDETARQILSAADPQLAGSLLIHFSTEGRTRISEHISGRLKSAIAEILDYPEGSVGRIMTTDFILFNKHLTAEEAIEKIRLLAKKRRFPASYAYVADDDKRLIGVLNMRDLMLADAEETLESIMIRDIFSVHCFVDREDATREMEKRKFFAAPVVDSENRILGIIKAERMIHGVREEVIQGLQKMFGAGGDEKPFSGMLFSLKKRLPWLHVNLATAFLAAAVVALFEGIIAKLTVLAVFLPVVAGQGGNAGAQSLAIVMRGLVMREIPKEKIFALIVKEGCLGAVNGAVIGLVTAIVAWLWQGNPFLGLVIGLGMLINLIVAGLSGASIPILMKRFGLDPAQSSSIILTTVTDVLGFLAFLGFAVLFQDFLV